MSDFLNSKMSLIILNLDLILLSESMNKTQNARFYLSKLLLEMNIVVCANKYLNRHGAITPWTVVPHLSVIILFQVKLDQQNVVIEQVKTLLAIAKQQPGLISANLHHRLDGVPSVV